MQPDPVRAFKRAAQADVTYYILYGTLDFDASKQPKAVVEERRNFDPIPAVFRGHGLSKTGFDLPFESAISLQPLCAGVWCGQTDPYTPALIFAQVYPDGILVDVGPCDEQVFLNPTPETLDAMTQCISEGC